MSKRYKECVYPHSVDLPLGKVNEINICTIQVSAVSLPETYPQKFKYIVHAWMKNLVY